MAALEQVPTAYEILGVHPSAPRELISACYWAITRDLEERRATESDANVALHRLTHAYESVADPVRRGGYNLSIGYTDEPLMKRALPHPRFFLLRVFRRSHMLGWSVDPHEVLGLHPSAPQAQVSVAYSVMNDNYLRLPPGSRRREALLNLLDESYAVLRDPQKRAQLAGVGSAEQHEPPTPPLGDPPVSDLPELSQPDVAAANVALPIPAPAPIEPPNPHKTALPIPRGPVSSTAGSKDAGIARRVAVAVSAFTVAAARSVARSVRSGWLAARKWLRRHREDRRKTRANRSREASSRPATPNEVFLGRLASTVGKSKIERRPSSDETTLR